MGSVVGSHDIDQPRANSSTQCLPITERLDGWIPLDAVTQACIVLVGEDQMMHAGFGGDLLLRKREIIAEEGELPSRRDMEDMQATPQTGSKLYGFA